MISIINSRRTIAYSTLIAVAMLIHLPAAADEPKPVAKTHPTLTVYKSPTCGCCKGWASYLEHKGFNVNAIDHDNVDQIKAENGVTDPRLRSCHTALIDGYVIEGHVPANDIAKLLSQRPDVVGLSAPGMPMMSPGMSSLIPKNYDVIAFKEDGSTYIFSSY